MISVGALYLLENIYEGEAIPHNIRLRMVVFFNGPPYLVPYAIGAIATEIKNGTDENKIMRFMQSVVGMLGAVGDQFYWDGLKPLMLISICCFAIIFPIPIWVGLFTLLAWLIYNYYQVTERKNGIILGKAKGFGVVSDIKSIKNRWGTANFSFLSFSGTLL